MALKNQSDCLVIITIEIGHQANFLKERSIEGFTHDWTVFVRGYEGSKIEHFVEKVVFNLHKTFKSPVRSISTPPYKVSECGYAGFILPIDIYFRAKQKPRKLTFNYDMFVNAKDQPPINNVRYEKLKFQNPTPDFKAKLIKAGGSGIGSGPLPPVVADRSHNTEGKTSAKPLRKKEKKEKKEKKKKEKKAKKVSIRGSSPHPSLSSLSPLSSDEEPEKPVYVKKEKEVTPLKKESVIPISSLIKKEPSSSSSVKEKSSNHKKNSSPEKERHSSEKHKNAKAHKSKEKISKSSSDPHREGKKDGESSFKNKDAQHIKHKDKEDSHISSKSSSSSSHGEKKSSSSSHKEKPNKEKDKLLKEKHKEKSHKSKVSSEEKTSSKEKEKQSHKESISSSSVIDSAKKSQEVSKSKNSSHDKDKHSNSKHSYKRPLSPEEVHEIEKKKFKRDSESKTPVTKQPGSAEKEKGSAEKEKGSAEKEKGSAEKEKGSAEKEKGSSSCSSSSSIKETKLKDGIKISPLSSSSTGKIKEHKNKKSSDKSKLSSHSSEGKTKSNKNHANLEKQESSSQKLHSGQKSLSKTGKLDTISKSEKLAMSADFQPQLMLSPLKCRSDDEDSHNPVVDLIAESSGLKRTRSSSSISSLSSHHSDNEAHKSDDGDEKRAESSKKIVSGLIDSDSEAAESPSSKTVLYDRKLAVPGKELNKERKSPTVVDVKHKRKEDSGSSSNRSSPYDKPVKSSAVEKPDRNIPVDMPIKPSSTVDKSSSKKIQRGDVRNEKKKPDSKERNKTSESVVILDAQNSNVEPTKNGLNVLAPNGIPLEDLIYINERIEKALQDSNKDVINCIIDIIAETDNFDIDDSDIFFDICSMDKNCVLQIQSVLCA